MQGIVHRVKYFPLIGLTLAAAAFAADQPASPANPPPDAPVSRQEYNQLKKDYEELRQEMAEIKATTQKQGAAQSAPPAQPAAPPQGGAATQSAAATQPSDDGQPPLTGIGAAVSSLFAPTRTQNIYFSPFEIMNPEHMRADMPMQIGHWEDLNLHMGLETVGRFQAIHQDNVSVSGVSQAGLDPGFQNPFANLNFLATIPDKMDIYFDMYIASRPHPNTMYGHEGYLLFKQLPVPFGGDNGLLAGLFDEINVKVGAFDIDFGDQNYRRSNNARVQRNPLIGNYLVDPNVEEIGGEVYSIKGPFHWLVGLGSGTTTEHFDYGAAPSFHAKLWANPLPEVRTSVSFYDVHLGGSADTSYLFTNGRSGGTYAAVFGGGDNPGQILPQGGKDVTAVQSDLTWNHWPWEIYSFVGWTQDSDINGPAAGSPSERWLYGAAESVYHITPALYLAGRYSFGSAESVNGVNTDGWVDRAEFGGGYWFTRTILGKVEYVYEKYHDFGSAEGIVSGVDAARGPDFMGAVIEVSCGF